MFFLFFSLFCLINGNPLPPLCTEDHRSFSLPDFEYEFIEYGCEDADPTIPDEYNVICTPSSGALSACHQCGKCLKNEKFSECVGNRSTYNYTYYTIDENGIVQPQETFTCKDVVAYGACDIKNLFPLNMFGPSKHLPSYVCSECQSCHDPI